MSTAADTTGAPLPEHVDPDALRDVLDGRWAHVRQQARTHLTGTKWAPVYGEDIEAARTRTTALARDLAKTGQTALGFSKEHGGGDDLGGSVASIEMVAMTNLSLMVKVGVQWGLFGGAVQALGTDEHHAALVPDIISMELPGCFAMTETGHGSDVQQLRTTCTYDPQTQTFDLHTPHEAARKDYIGNAARDGQMAVVFAQLVTQGKPRGVHAWAVPIRDKEGNPAPGVTITDDGYKEGLAGVDNGRLSFDHVKVPRSALLNRYGQVAEDGGYTSPIESETGRFFTMLGTLVRGRVSVGGASGSAAKVALDIAVRYGETRRQFSAPGRDREIVILDYLAHQRKLLPALAKTYALHFAQEELTAMMHDVLTAGDDAEPEVKRELESLAAGLKATNTWHANQTIQTCREACGGAGYLAENQLPLLKSDIDVFTTFEGDNTVLMQLVAKGLLTGYADDFGDLSGWGKAQFAANMVVDQVLERTAARRLVQRLVDAVPGNDEEASVRDRDWQLHMFEDREKHVLEGAANRLRRAGDEDADAFEVFNDAQDHVLRTAHVHVERVVLEAFITGIDRCTDPEARALLERVCDLYALHTIEADKGWFLEHGRMNAARSKAVTATVNQLCKEIRPYATTLVDGFAIPREWMNSAILREEPARQEAMWEEDRRVLDQGQPGAEAPGTSNTATAADVPPGQ
ncbi:acyl-CoA dehydrogenase [Rhodococcus sp. X156]|uniref:acyl-CoA dehydrogenase family protein n=1 Tax=Rhodococcus sp. X156 TaxID=2499145 RepID=UPI000FDB0A35|nr:acyl-CoA dehydrogenase [Rhodococcus sp. X156]